MGAEDRKPLDQGRPADRSVGIEGEQEGRTTDGSKDLGPLG